MFARLDLTILSLLSESREESFKESRVSRLENNEHFLVTVLFDNSKKHLKQQSLCAFDFAIAVCIMRNLQWGLLFFI